MTSRRKRVLAIHYFFPPLGGAGVPRMLKFVKYLQDFGWDVAVLTSSTKVRWYGARDESLLEDVPPDVEVVRAREVPIARLHRRLAGILRRLRISRLTSFVTWPDETVGWLPFAAAAGRRLARRWRPDVIVSSSYPYTNHFIALALSRLFGIPWVADFRDPWTHNPQGTKPKALPWPLPQLNVRTERALVRWADRVIVVDDRLELEGLRADDRRRVVIPNGVDPADLELTNADATRAPSDRFRLTYVGTLYGERDADPVFRAVARLIRAGVIDEKNFELSIVGNVWLSNGGVASYGIPVDHVGYVDHARAVSEMRSATALLFYAPSSTWAPSGKIFEYLVSGRPVLSVARRDNLAYQLVTELDAGAAAEPDDPAAIEQALELLYNRWQAGTLDVSPDVRARTLERFSRRGLTGDLARVLDDLLDDPHPSRTESRHDHSVDEPAPADALRGL
jgi:glycosyltransferase involved in cell wall biosynthesis